MKPVRRNRRLVLEAAVAQGDGMGGITEVWEPQGVLWAGIVAGSGREVAVDLVLQERVGLRITVRAAPPGAPSRPLPGQRFREGARIYPIRAVAEADAEGRYLVCFAEEGARA
jgi:head-tail adaptor